MEVNVCVCYCVRCVIEANHECYIGTIHYSCELVTYRALFLVDDIRNRALRCKCRVRRIFPSFLYSKRRKVVQNNLEVESEEDEDLNS